MKSATRKKLTIILGILILLVIFAALFLPRLIDPNQYHSRIVSELEKALYRNKAGGHRFAHRNRRADPYGRAGPGTRLVDSPWSTSGARF